MAFECQKNYQWEMEMSSIEKKMKTNNSRFIYNLLNHEITFDYILQTDPDLTDLKWQGYDGFYNIITMTVAKLFSMKKYVSNSEQCGKSFLVMIKFCKCFIHNLG